MLDPVKNFAKVAVSTGYDDAATTVVLSASEGAKLPAPATDGAFNLVWWNSTDYGDPSDDPNVEIVRCTARATDTLTVTRAQDSTAASTKNTGGKSYKMAVTPMKKLVDDLNTQLLTSLVVAISDETSVLTTGTAKVTFHMPYDFSLTKVKAGVTVASSSGNPAFDLNDDGVSVFATTVTIDSGEKFSDDATTPSALTSTPLTIAKGSLMTIDVDTAGTGTGGAKLYLIGYVIGAA